MATIKEIAKECNVSVATVSNILNHKPGASEETRKRVMDKVKERNYMPNTVAQNLKKRNTRSIGVIVEDMTIFSIPNIVDGITEHCEEKQYQILLSNLRLFQKYHDKYYHKEYYYEFVRRQVQELMAKQVEGIIYVAAHERTMKGLLEELPIPAVMAYGCTLNAAIPSVVVDDESGAYELVSMLIGSGHQKIGVVTGKIDSFHTQERLRGYQRALYDAGIMFHPELICIGDWERSSGYRYADQLMEHGGTAIFCMNDLMAGGVYDRMTELQKTVGRDIALVGYDGRELAEYYKPRLTTMELPLHDVGYMASRLMFQLLEKETIQEIDGVCRVKCRIRLRESI